MEGIVLKIAKYRILTFSLLFGLLISITASMIQFSADCDRLRPGFLRLHILANSDSPEDQAAKLAVRDRLQTEFAGLFSDANSESQAEEVALANLEMLKAAAEDELEKVGRPAEVTVKLVDRFFTTTEYEDFVLPAGQYRALQVSIGEAEGRNWWCVAFPPLCLPAATQGEQPVMLTPREEKLLQKSGGYQLKFKIVEIYQQLKNKLSGNK